MVHHFGRGFGFGGIAFGGVGRGGYPGFGGMGRGGHPGFCGMGRPVLFHGDGTLHGPPHAFPPPWPMGFRGQDCKGRGQMRQSKPVLTYFDTEGLGESIRLCLLVGDVPFVDRRVTPEEWGKYYKAFSPSGRAPYLEVEGKVLVESQAVLQYAASCGGLMPSSPEDVLKVQMIIERMENENLKEYVENAPEFADRESRFKWIVKKMKENYPGWCDKYEALFVNWLSVDDEEEFLVGRKMSYLDVYIAAVIIRFQSNTQTDLIPDEKKYPVLTKVYQGVVSNSRVAAYLDAQKRKTQKMVLHHFGYPMVQSIIWAMKIGKIAFEEKIVTREEWDQGYKSQSPSGQLPMLEVNGEKYVESVAILQYVASRADILPEGPFQAAHALAVVKLCGELRDLVGRVCHCTDPSAKEALVEKAEKITIPETLARVEEVLGQQQDVEGHVVGRKLSYADLSVAHIFAVLLNAAQKGIHITDVEMMAPRMKKTHDMVMVIPDVEEVERQQMVNVKPVLTYFHFPGGAESLRYAMHVAGIEFEDRRVTREDWANIYKAMSPTGQCPFLTVGQGQTIVETKAIMQWIQEAAPQLKPSGPMGTVIAEQLVSSWGRVHVALRPLYDVPEAERWPLEAKVRDEGVAPVLALQERLWADSNTHEGYSVGGKMTWVDAWVAGEIEHLKAMHMMSDNWHEKYPTLAGIYERFQSNPRVAAYRVSQGHV